MLFYFYNDEFNRRFSLKMKNPGCFVCTFVFFIVLLTLTLSQFFPLPSYCGLAPKERLRERRHLSQQANPTSLMGKSKAKSASTNILPVQRLFLNAMENVKDFFVI